MGRGFRVLAAGPRQIIIQVPPPGLKGTTDAASRLMIESSWSSSLSQESSIHGHRHRGLSVVSGVWQCVLPY